MKRCALLVAALLLSAAAVQAQAVAEFRVLIGKEFEVTADAPTDGKVNVYTLDVLVTGWRAGNAATRLIVGFGSGRESADIAYHVVDAAGKQVLDKMDTIRTNFSAQGASTGTLAHPFAQKIAQRIRDANLK